MNRRAVVIICFALLWPLPQAISGASAAQLALTVVDGDTRQPISCRMHLKNAAGRPRKAERAPFWHDHFVFPGNITLRLPPGQYTFELERGPEYAIRTGHFTIDAFSDDHKEVDLHRHVDMSAEGWWSADLDVHRPVGEMGLLMSAEDLHIAQVVTWSHERGLREATLPKTHLISVDDRRYYHVMAGEYTSDGTSLLLFHLPLPTPWKDGVQSAKTSKKPLLSMSDIQRFWDCQEAWVDLRVANSQDLPLLIALGKVDSVEIAPRYLTRDTANAEEPAGKPRDPSRFPGPWGNAQWWQQIYFKLLDCGLRIPPTAGSGSGVSPNPVGYNRVYVHIDGELGYDRWWGGLKAGRVTVTNGPLMRPLVNGELPGHVFVGELGRPLELEIGLTLSTREPISYLEVIVNGEIVHSIRFADYAKSGRLPKLRFDRSGWFTVRAVTDLPKTYRFAMSGPYYVEFDQQRRISRQAAKFFLDWVYERARQIRQADTPVARELLPHYRKTRDYWQDVLSRANAD